MPARPGPGCTGRCPTPSASTRTPRSRPPTPTWPGASTVSHLPSPREPTMPDTTTSHRHEDLSIDQQLALRTAANRLAGEFAGSYGPETIEQFLHTSY